MHRRPFAKRFVSPVTAIGCVALVAALGGGAYAAIPGADGAIDGCYAPSGALRMIDTAAGETCKGKETAIRWNRRGPQGEPGVAGPRGPAGPQGPQGAQGLAGEGLTGFHTVRGYSDSDATNFKSLEVDCPPGEIATGGGASIGGMSSADNLLPVIYASGPRGYFPTGWRALATSKGTPSNQTWTLIIDVVCARRQ